MKDIAALIVGFSGREISKLAIAWQVRVSNLDLNSSIEGDAILCTYNNVSTSPVWILLL